MSGERERRLRSRASRWGLVRFQRFGLPRLGHLRGGRALRNNLPVFCRGLNAVRDRQVDGEIVRGVSVYLICGAAV